MTSLACCLVLFGAVTAGPALKEQSQSQAPASDAIRPYKVDVPNSALVDLRRRIVATRWPEQETVVDQSQGAQLARLQELVQYWRLP